MNLISIPSVFTWCVLALTLICFWIPPIKKYWPILLGLTLTSALISQNLFFSGLLITLIWTVLWLSYAKNQKPKIKWSLFFGLIALSFSFKFQLFPGFHPLFITPKFLLGLQTPLLGLLPLALVVPLAKTATDWKGALKGSFWGIGGIALLAILAVASGAVHWQFKLPSFAITRYASNLIFTSIPEEAFYRGFLQRTLGLYFHNTRKGHLLAILITSILFTLAHVYWSPSWDILAFVFLASLLYGAVYAASGKIESAIFTHFLLNLIHMTFFSYHAM